MHNNFYEPTRQAPIGIVANFLNTLQRLGRAFAPLIVIYIINGRVPLTFSVGGAVALILVLMLAFSYFSYRKFTFFVDESIDAFVIEKGVFNKSKITIQLDKIQQVNLNQSFINRIVNVYAVEIDSAGSKDKEAVIPSMAWADANNLKKILLNYQREQQADVAFEQGVESTDLQEKKTKIIGVSTLLKVGLTANYLYTAGLILVFVNMFLDSFMGKKVYEEYLDEDSVNEYVNSGFSALFAMYLVAFIIVLVLIVNVIRTLMKFWDFKVVTTNNTLVLSHGLISTRNTIIRPNRVQKVVLVQNYFQKLWDITSLKIIQVAGVESQNNKTGLEIPGCSTVEKAEFFDIIYNKQGKKQETFSLKYNYRFLGFRAFLLIGIPFAIYTILYYKQLPTTQFFSIAIGYSAVVFAMLYRLYRVGTLFVNEDFIVLKTGIWDIKHTYLEPHKIQKITLSQLWWQQSANVGSLTLQTAGGPLRFSTSKYNELRKLRDIMLYKVEVSDKNWM